METGIKVQMDAQSIRTLGQVILSILKSGQDQATIQAALGVLPKALNQNTSLLNCQIGDHTNEERSESKSKMVDA